MKTKRSERLMNRWSEPESRNVLLSAIKKSASNPEFLFKMTQIFNGGKSPLAIYHYILKDPDGNIWETDCWREFAREHGLHQSSMVRMVSNNKRTDKGWYLVSRTLRENMIEDGDFL